MINAFVIVEAIDAKFPLAPLYVAFLPRSVAVPHEMKVRVRAVADSRG